MLDQVGRGLLPPDTMTIEIRTGSTFSSPVYKRTVLLHRRHAFLEDVEVLVEDGSISPARAHMLYAYASLPS